MSLFLFLTVLQGLLAAALVGLILMQKSEGGGLGLGGGGSPSSIFSARGAGDFLTRSTAILAFLFVTLSIVLAAVAVDASTGGEIDDSLYREQGQAGPGADPLAPPSDPLAPVGAAPQAVPSAAAAVPAADPNDPLSGLAE